CGGGAYDIATGKRLPKRPAEYAWGRDGRLYGLEPEGGNWRNLKVVRYRADGKPEPFEKTGTVRIGKSLFFTVDPKGNVYSTVPNGGIAKYGPDGTLVRKDFIDMPLPYSSNYGSVSSLMSDWDGNIYLSGSLKPAGHTIPDFFVGRLPWDTPTKPAPRFFYERFYGSVAKFGPEGGRLENDPKGPYRMGHNYRGYSHVRATGLQWSHVAMSYVLYRHYNYARCNCERSEFDMDRFDRIFIPNAFRFCVEIIDKQRNVLLRLGRYGTWRDAGDEGATGKRGPELGWVTSVRARDGFCLIGDNVNNRLWKVELGYHSEEKIPLRYAGNRAKKRD
ncbi:hypothetical protein LCGC14_3026310, partial [marine sediment metagenome]